MTYRCPYCKRALGASPEPHCPGCGKIMVVPKMREPNARLARRRVLENIRRDCERKKAELRFALAPGALRNPKFYFGIIVILAVIGFSLMSATEKAVKGRGESPVMRALRHVDTLAVALGRYRFHTGQFPTAEQGFAALLHDPQVPRWDGPYVSMLCTDPWGQPYRYGPPSGDGLPDVFSCGPDRQRGTPDDLRPDPASFEPGTAWTNGWVSFEDRLPGVRIIRGQDPGGASTSEQQGLK